MTTLTIRLSGDTARRLKALASSRGISLDNLMEEVSEAALTAYDAEARFKAMAAKGNPSAALEILGRLDRNDRPERE